MTEQLSLSHMEKGCEVEDSNVTNIKKQILGGNVSGTSGWFRIISFFFLPLLFVCGTQKLTGLFFFFFSPAAAAAKSLQLCLTLCHPIDLLLLIKNLSLLPIH